MPNRDLTVTAIQTALHWEDKHANLNHFEKLFERINEKTDLIVLPEMFTTGFSMKPEAFSENSAEPTLNWMRRQAAKMNAVVTGSIIVEEGLNYFNRLLWVRPDGSFEQYSKRHLFRLGNEHNHYTAGNKKLIVDLHGWKICPLVCYDLRFPVWSRNNWTGEGKTLQADYDVLIYVANWPEVRSHPWKTLLMARAMENLSYVVGVNRIGNDGKFIYHSGDSAIIDFKGEYLKTAVFATEDIITTTLSHQLLNEFRTAFPAGMDADSFQIR
jgi:omega-amidase